jgi:hypothetical protein
VSPLASTVIKMQTTIFCLSRRRQHGGLVVWRSSVRYQGVSNMWQSCYGVTVAGVVGIEGNLQTPKGQSGNSI